MLRRDLMLLTAGVVAGGLTAPQTADAAPAGSVQPADAAEAHLIFAKLNADLSGRTVFYFTQGTIWGLKPQADDLTLAEFVKPAYGYSNLVARKVVNHKDGQIVIRTKSWNFYRDPKSGQISDRIFNLYTGVEDKAPPMSGPVSEKLLGGPPGAGGAYPTEVAATTAPYGMRIRKAGAHAFINTTNFVRLHPNDTTWWKLEADMTSHTCLVKDLENPRATHIPNTRNQNLVAEWQTWTRMHGQPGHIMFKGEGAPLAGVREIPAEVRAAIDSYFPGQFAPVERWDG